MRETDLFVIDTNILISAFILPSSTSRRALNKARKLGLVVLSQACIDEFAEVFVRPKFDKYLPLSIRLDIIDEFISLAYIINPEIKIDICRDPKDNKFLELAVAANATCLLSGDADLLDLKEINQIPITSLSEFLLDG
jgi:putative PIN family toxin of toxin-antitoxin system